MGIQQLLCKFESYGLTYTLLIHHCTKVISINNVEINQNIIEFKAIKEHLYLMVFRLPKTKKSLQIANSLYNNAGENNIITEAATPKENYQLCCTDVPFYAISNKITTKEYTRLFNKRLIFNSLKTIKAKLAVPIEIMLRVSSAAAIY